MKMTIYVCNAFSLSMLDRIEQRASRGVGKSWTDPNAPDPRIPRPIEDPVEWLQAMEADCKKYDLDFEIISAVGHADTARVFSTILGRDIEPNRITVKLGHQGNGVFALIGQVMFRDGSPCRLPEGTIYLPPDVVIEWWMV